MTVPTYVINAIQNGKNSELELEGGKARQVGIVGQWQVEMVEDLKCAPSLHGRVVQGAQDLPTRNAISTKCISRQEKTWRPKMSRCH